LGYKPCPERIFSRKSSGKKGVVVVVADSIRTFHDSICFNFTQVQTSQYSPSISQKNIHFLLRSELYIDSTDKRVGVFASAPGNAEVIFSLGWFTPYITLFSQGLFEVSEDLKQRLHEHGYQLEETPVAQFVGEDHVMTGVELTDGGRVDLDAGLISMGSQYPTAYLEKFALEKQGGNLVTDKLARTSHPHIFAIGDLKVGLNQVVIAAADGALASTQIWRDIRRATGAKHW
jgi:thioredoxin reductase (NADPH)